MPPKSSKGAGAAPPAAASDASKAGGAPEGKASAAPAAAPTKGGAAPPPAKSASADATPAKGKAAAASPPGKAGSPPDADSHGDPPATKGGAADGKAAAAPAGKAGKADSKATEPAAGGPPPKGKAKAPPPDEPAAAAEPVEATEDAVEGGGDDVPGENAAETGETSGGPVDVSALTKRATDDLGLEKQPPDQKYKCVLVEIYVQGEPNGGTDKSSNGHRYDTIPIANGMISNGMSCQLIHYVYQEHDDFFEVCGNFDAIIVRCNPGQIKADGGDQGKFDDGMRKLRQQGKQVWPSPDVMESMGAKDALCKVSKLNIGLQDTFAYYNGKEFTSGFKQTMAFQPRVIKQNRGSSGEGIWIVKLKSGKYAETFGKKSCPDDEILVLTEANDNHEEEHTVAEFIEFCVNGRTSKSGTWSSKGQGKYLEGGKAAGGQLVDQRFCPRIVEGELRYNMVGDDLLGIIHKKPKDGGISAVGGTGSIYTFYGPEEPKFNKLTDSFLKDDLKSVMPALGLAEEPLPLWWTTDFILSSPKEAAEEKWIVGEFNCSCVGISKCLAACCTEEKPSCSYKDISEADRSEAEQIGVSMGKAASNILVHVERGTEHLMATPMSRIMLDNMPLDQQELLEATQQRHEAKMEDLREELEEAIERFEDKLQILNPSKKRGQIKHKMWRRSPLEELKVKTETPDDEEANTGAHPKAKAEAKAKAKATQKIAAKKHDGMQVKLEQMEAVAQVAKKQEAKLTELNKTKRMELDRVEMERKKWEMESNRLWAQVRHLRLQVDYMNDKRSA